MSNAILGTAVGYSEGQVAPFFASLQNAGYRGDIVLFVDRMSRRRFETSPVFRGVHLVDVPHLRLNVSYLVRYRWFRLVAWRPLQVLEWSTLRLVGSKTPSAVTPRTWPTRLARRIIHPQLARFIFYADFLRVNRFDRVLLSDVRDVIFQRDPFECLPATGLAVGLETRRNSIRSEYWNRTWIRDGYGENVLLQLGDRAISCAGVTYGDYASISQYLTLMVDGILRAPLRLFARLGDQGIHNYLLWTGKLGEVHYLNTFKSPVATLNGADARDVHVNCRGHLINDDGTEVAIVHQYDRSPQLMAVLLASLASQTDATQPFSDVRVGPRPRRL